MNKIIRWQQRYQNFTKAYARLEEAVVQIDSLNQLAKEGLIQRFEYTFELAWKTLKDFLESKGVQAQFPRDIIKQSFKNDLIGDGDIWIEMLDKRNLLSHTYDESNFEEAITKIVNSYFTPLKKLHETLETKL